VNDKKDHSKLIPPHGEYRDLQSYQMSEIVYDGTAVFCDRFISLRSRTHDQMVQAVARMAIAFHGGQAGNGIWSSRFQ
jgi:restriction system protein